MIIKNVMKMKKYFIVMIAFCAILFASCTRTSKPVAPITDSTKVAVDTVKTMVDTTNIVK